MFFSFPGYPSFCQIWSSSRCHAVSWCCSWCCSGFCSGCCCGSILMLFLFVFCLAKQSDLIWGVTREEKRRRLWFLNERFVVIKFSSSSFSSNDNWHWERKVLLVWRGWFRNSMNHEWTDREGNYETQVVMAFPDMQRKPLENKSQTRKGGRDWRSDDKCWKEEMKLDDDVVAGEADHDEVDTRLAEWKKYWRRSSEAEILVNSRREEIHTIIVEKERATISLPSYGLILEKKKLERLASWQVYYSYIILSASLTLLLDSESKIYSHLGMILEVRLHLHIFVVVTQTQLDSYSLPSVWESLFNWKSILELSLETQQNFWIPWFSPLTSHVLSIDMRLL